MLPPEGVLTLIVAEQGQSGVVTVTEGLLVDTFPALSTASTVYV